jgi:hypothetical protein
MRNKAKPQLSFLATKVFNVRRFISIGFGLMVLFVFTVQAQEKTFHEGSEAGGEGVVKYEGKPLQGQVSNAKSLEGQVSHDEVKFQAMTPKMGVLRLPPGAVTLESMGDKGCDYITMTEKTIDAGGEQVVVKSPEKHHSDPPCVSYIDPGAAQGLIKQGDRIIAVNGIDYVGTDGLGKRFDPPRLLNQGLFKFQTIVIERDGKLLKPIKVQWNPVPGGYWTAGRSDPSDVMDDETLARYDNWEKDKFRSKSPYAPEQYE